MIQKAFPLFIMFLFVHYFLHAQQKVNGTVLDARSKEVIPFATVRFGENGQGIIGGLDGKFEIPAEYLSEHITSIEVTCMGYQTKKIALPLNNNKIYLQPGENILREIIIKPPYEKIRRILSKTIANKHKNNPDKYDWYRCHVYYKMIVDISLPDSVIKDTSAKKRKISDFFNGQHLLISETYSIRTWRKPLQLQEDVLASRFSGLKKAMFTSLITDVQPFHAYSDYLTLNGKDYHNPVSHGFEQYYKFNLIDEIMQGEDTIWVLSFRPNGRNTNDLSGTVYINSNGYAISHIIAKASDTKIKMNVRIEQQYEQVPVAGNESRWFPKHLNYIIDWQQQSSKTTATLHMKGNSYIDSVTWAENNNFHFDKAHTVRLAASAVELTDTAWKAIRPQPLDTKEIRTYKVIDSIGSRIHSDEIIAFFSKTPEGKLPFGTLDLDLKRLFSYNQYENLRLGLGLQTNEKFIKWLSVGGWAGYGFGDKQWKYGAFTEVYADRYKEFVFKAGYTDDINDPGRVHLNRDLDKNYLNYYLLQRVDETKTISASLKKRIGYWNIELTGRQQQILPKYRYALDYGNTEHTNFTANEASISLRYAFSERTAPFYSSYTSLGTGYPIWYANITSGSLESGNMGSAYTQAVSAILWHKHINQIGFEHLLLEGGKSWSNGPLPLSKLFAGNGYKYDTRSVIDLSLYTFGGMMTIYPYEYYTDQFVNFIFRHDFDWKLYKADIKRTGLSSIPNICLQYNMLYGTLNNPSAQKYVAFSIPDNAYHEVGLLLNNILRIQELNLYYFNLNLGYFYHITPAFDASKNGRFVLGAGFEL